MRALTACEKDYLSGFFFDIRKDCHYCDAPADPKRRAYRTVLDTLFHALVRYAAPVIPFTAEEVWQSRFPSEEGSVHFLEWPEVDAKWKRSEEHTSELQSLMRISYAVFCLKKKKLEHSTYRYIHS